MLNLSIGRNAHRWQTGLVLTGLALSCGACASGPGTTPGTHGFETTRGQEPADVFSTAMPERFARYAEHPNAGTVRLGQQSPALTNGWCNAYSLPGSAIQLAGHEASVVQCPPEAIDACPPDPRQPVAGPYPYGIGMAACDVMCQPSPHLYPDEYLCDGGDREWPVHYGEDSRLGLDTEDTVAEFKTHHGQEGLTRSNRVCVYAPRFASVRSVSLPYEEGNFRELGGVQHAGFGSEVRARMAITQGNKNIAASGALIRSRASGLESEQMPTDVQQRLRPQVHDKVLNAYEDINFFNTGLLDQSAVARLNLGIHAAMIWSREQSPVIQGKLETATTGVSEIRATALTVIEEDDTPGTLRIVKAADKSTAEVGDVVTFTIRYDNLGTNPVSTVRIIDNLTPRMEYVDDSATCDVAGRLVVQDNGEGSLILIWELAEPVPGKTGGVVSFKARVR